MRITESWSYSAASSSSAYGSNGMTFPFAGARRRCCSKDARPGLGDAHPPRGASDGFYGVPTLFAAILADVGNGRASGSDRPAHLRLRRRALAEGDRRALARPIRADILDGIGSTEMLHIFLSLREDDIRYGTTGKPVPGYELRIVDESGRESAGRDRRIARARPLERGSPTGTSVRSRCGPSRAAGPNTGDKYRRDEQGYYVYCGRSDDMIKASGQWVSPAEVESALVGHPAVLEAAVVAHADDQKLDKPKAFVVLKKGATATAEELQRFVKERLAPYKYPRWIAFVEELPKTATGKIQAVQAEGDGVSATSMTLARKSSLRWSRAPAPGARDDSTRFVDSAPPDWLRDFRSPPRGHPWPRSGAVRRSQAVRRRPGPDGGVHPKAVIVGAMSGSSSGPRPSTWP